MQKKDRKTDVEKTPGNMNNTLRYKDRTLKTLFVKTTCLFFCETTTTSTTTSCLENHKKQKQEKHNNIMNRLHADYYQ